MNKEENEDKYTPDWAHRAKHIPHKPVWVDKIPHELWELGEVFFPIPKGRKGYNYNFHLESKRFSADSEILNAYLEAGSNYGICCAGDLAVVDIDEQEYAPEITKKLPETVYQVSGSREGYHLFYYCPGLDTRIVLDKGDDHIGEVKCDPHGFVVGPGSTHPSGNKYGPLKGDSIATIEKEELEDVLDEYSVDNGNEVSTHEINRDTSGQVTSHDFYELSANDVLPWLEEDNRIPHPVHGSSTGSNFMKNEGGDTFTCWRCQWGSGDGCGLSGAQFLACEGSGLDCDDVRRRWRGDRYDPVIHYKGWSRAIEQGLVSPLPLDYTFIKGYAIDEEIIGEEDELEGEQFWTVRNALLYELRHL